MNIVGKTEDGRYVMSGIFHLYATRGLPLSILFMGLYDNNMIPSPIHFYEDAIGNGWNHKTIFNKLREAYQDSYGDVFWKEVEIRLNKYLEYMEKKA
jgi:hypothetical protein